MQKQLLKFWMLLCMLMVGMGAWAGEETYNFSSFTQAQDVVLNATNFTITLSKNTAGTSPAWSSNQARVYAKGSLNITSEKTITKIVYSYVINANKSGVSPTIDGVTGSENAGNWNEETKTWTGSDKDVTLSTSGTAGNVGFTSVTVTYEESAGGDDPVKYTITKNPCSGGSFTVSSTSAVAGTTITLTPTPANGYEFTSWSVVDASSNSIAVTNNQFTLPESNVTVSATFTENLGGTYVEWDMTNANSIKEAITGGVQFASSYITMKAVKTATETSPTNYLGGSGSYDHTRFYNGNKVTFTPSDGYYIKYIKVYLNSSSPGQTAWSGGTKDNCSVTTGSKNDELGIKGYAKIIPVDCTSEVSVKLNGNTNFDMIRVVYAARPTINITTTEGYSTFVCEDAIVMPENFMGAVAELNGNDLTWNWMYEEGDIVPANTPILVFSTETSVNPVVTTAAGTAPATNYLVANTTGAAAQASTLAPSSVYYGLTYNQSHTDLGFYWVAAGGASFSVPAGKVILAVPVSAGAKTRFVFNEDEEATAIESVETVKGNSAAYNLNGQRVNANTKGIVIINGKKFYNK